MKQEMGDWSLLKREIGRGCSSGMLCVTEHYFSYVSHSPMNSDRDRKSISMLVAGHHKHTSRLDYLM
jgi:hypothetical protein